MANDECAIGGTAVVFAGNKGIARKTKREIAHLLVFIRPPSLTGFNV